MPELAPVTKTSASRSSRLKGVLLDGTDREPSDPIDLRLRNALDHLPRKADDDRLQELRWLYDRRDLTEAKEDLAQWLSA